jgi:hypothetical protein
MSGNCPDTGENMINNPESYSEAGRKAAEARNQRDEARAEHWARYYRSMRGIENPEDRQQIDRLYHEAYTAARII